MTHSVPIRLKSLASCKFLKYALRDTSHPVDLVFLIGINGALWFQLFDGSTTRSQVFFIAVLAIFLFWLNSTIRFKPGDNPIEHHSGLRTMSALESLLGFIALIRAIYGLI